jgi:hypothetical protein
MVTGSALEVGKRAEGDGHRGQIVRLQRQTKRLTEIPSGLLENRPRKCCAWAMLVKPLANRCCADRAELIATAQIGSIRVRRDPELLRSFLAWTGLTL